MAATLVASAITVQTSPGRLADDISYPADVTSLTVKGSINAADLYFIADKMTALTTLDLSGATIAEYNGKAINNQRTFPAATIPDGLFAGSKLSSVALPAGVNLGTGAFVSSDLSSVNIPASITLQEGVFAGCPNLANATVATASIPASTFNNCPALKVVTLSGVTSIGDYAFKNCTALATVSGSSSVTSIGASAFAGCSALKDFTFSRNLTAIGNYAFAYSGLTAADLAGSTKLDTIGNWAFSHCSTMTKATLPNSLSAYPEGLFFDCSALHSVVAPNDVTVMNDYAFKGTSNLNATSLLPGGLTTIGRFALAGNTATSNLILPATLIRIDDNAMEGMTGLTEISASSLNDVPELGTAVWQGVDQATVELLVNENTYDAFAAADQWKNFNITRTTGVGNVVDDVTFDISSIRGRFVGYDLLIDFGGHDVEGVALYNTAGVCLATLSPGSDQAVSIDTSSWSDRIYLVVVALENGSKASLKLGRSI